MKPLRVALSIVGIGVLLLMPQRVAAQGTDPVSVINAYIAALNAGNADAAANLFTDGAAIADPGIGTYSGKAQVLILLKIFVGAKNQSELVGTPQVSGDKVTWVESVSSEGESHKYNGEAVVQDGKITSLNYATLEEEPTASPTGNAAATPAAAPKVVPTTGGSYSSIFGWLFALVGLALLGFGWSFISLSKRRR